MGKPQTVVVQDKIAEVQAAEAITTGRISTETRIPNRTMISASVVFAAASVFLWFGKLDLPGASIWAWLSMGLWSAVFAKWLLDKLLIFKFGPTAGK